MKLSIDIDDRLLNEALKLTKLKNARDVIELGLKTLVRLKDQSTARQENSLINSKLPLRNNNS